MKKSKITNIIVLSLNILFCIISLTFAWSCDTSSISSTYTNLLLVPFASLVVTLVMVVLSKKKLIMIPMLVLFLNAFLICNITSSPLLNLANSGTALITINALDFAMITLSILGIVFTCLKHKWGAVVGIIGVAFMIYSTNNLIIGLNAIKENLDYYDLFVWSATSALFQFIWLLIPMISLLCEKKENEEVPQIEEHSEIK